MLGNQENRDLPPLELCQRAGYATRSPWLHAIRDEYFVAAVRALGRPLKKVPSKAWTASQRKLLAALEHQENRSKPIRQLCAIAGVSPAVWYWATQDSRFVETLQAMGVRVERTWADAHIDVSLAAHPEEELAKDIWDIRRLRSDYPKHDMPSDFIVDFTWIVNPQLRQQVKQYFRHRLTRWKPRTFRIELTRLKAFFSHLPPEVHVGTITRQHIEAILPRMGQKSGRSGNEYFRAAQAMFKYMATSPAWTGPRPPQFLILPEDIPSRAHTLPRPIPPEVTDQLDALLEEAVQQMTQGHRPHLLSPMFWNAILVLRRTGMRCEDMAHLKAPDEHDRNGCLDQDTDGYWWIRLSHDISKMNRDHRLPTKFSDGVVETVRRQRDLVKHVTNHYGENYLFRNVRGVLTRSSLQTRLKDLSQYLTYEGHPYVISPHQFRHTIATDMIEQGVDIYTVKEYLGHKSVAMTERYVMVYLKSLKAKFDAYRVKKLQSYASEMITKEVEVSSETGDVDGGWVEGKVGKLYISPLPDGIGNCAHLAMLDPCPTPPHCPTCPKLRASKRHLPVWENKVQNLLITVEALRANPAYARARQKHEQELAHAEKVVKTIQEEGFWDGRIHNG